MQSYFQSMSI